MIGRYCYYKGNTYIVVKDLGDKVSLLDPLKGNNKLIVLKGNILPRPEHAQRVTFRNSDYLVTHKLMIISVKTGRVMKWSSNDPIRNEILELYKMEK